jgi:hemerythrin-like domain-containing protein
MPTEPLDTGRELRDQVKVWSQVGSARDFEEGALALTPADVLLPEHDLIRRVITVLDREAERIGEGRDVNPVFIDRIVDFIYTYADRVHHGKEVEVLFRELDTKPLSPEHRQMMERLVREHVEMRHLAEDLVEARERYAEGDEAALKTVEDTIDRLSDLYPDHFQTEEQTFFPAAQSYLDDSEKEAILEAMRLHDRAMIHEKYGALVEDLEAVAETWQLSE